MRNPPSPDDPDGRIAELFAREVPEIASGVVEIKALARNPGSRTRIAVTSHDPTVDALSACVGHKGSHVQRISALLGERIDIVTWFGPEERRVKLALSPARVLGVELHPDKRRAIVVVPEDQYRLAMGRHGEDRDLASRLSGWDITIMVDTSDNA
jgi:transcription termination/antitermination protein NusA